VLLLLCFLNFIYLFIFIFVLLSLLLILLLLELLSHDKDGRITELTFKWRGSSADEGYHSEKGLTHTALLADIVTLTVIRLLPTVLYSTSVSSPIDEQRKELVMTTVVVNVCVWHCEKMHCIKGWTRNVCLSSPWQHRDDRKQLRWTVAINRLHYKRTCVADSCSNLLDKNSFRNINQRRRVVTHSGLRSERIRIPRGDMFRTSGGEFVLIAEHKKNQNRCHQTRFLGSKRRPTQNALAGELTALPRLPSWILGPLSDREGRAMKGKDKGRGKGGGWGREGNRK